MNFINWITQINLFDSIKRFYGALIDLIGFIVDKTSDQGADIAIRALPIVSPLPNAISMYYVSQTALHFTDWQAKAFAAAMELALFGLFEVVLKMFDGWQKKPARYKYPLRMAAGIAIFVMFLIIGVVAFVETDRPILATLPLFSAAGAAALSLRRWHAHNEEMEISGNLYVAHPILPVASGAALDRMNAARKAKIEQRRDTILTLIGGDGLSVADLALQVDCTPRTIRTDLDALQAAGHSMSVNGVVKLS